MQLASCDYSLINFTLSFYYPRNTTAIKTRVSAFNVATWQAVSTTQGGEVVSADAY
jgi:hypothetical protein